ncbi:hypothetical protein SLS62_005541 [Diatrype stigma]|uniref:Rab-GAP TBC domain-containing protein n=1 Tax=Diatrype stigma TaxID=117547 RepID=A0AAN9V309_9PEZI
MPSDATMIYGGSGVVDEVDIDISGPGSPPGMSSSKSSKTSSLRSYNSDDDNVVSADAAHFEEIGLDDDTATIDASHSRDFQQTKSAPKPYSASFASDLRAASARHVGPQIHAQAQSRDLARPHPPREITGKKSRPAFPPSRPPFRDTSTRNLSTIGPEPQRGPLSMRGMPVRSASTLSVNRRRRSPSPNQSLSPRDPNRPGLIRRSSWQTNRERKGIVELEKECDDDDDDNIPDGFILDNVPLSPRPPTERSSSRPTSTSTSPERSSSKEKARSVGNGTPSIATDSGSLRSPTWKTDASPNLSQLGASGASSPTKGRAKSWTAAISALSAEAKALTEKLEEHADELDKHGVYQQQSLQPAAKPRVKSAMAELPPLRRTNIMIDPLPVSKEKEAVLSRTRPSWLPPKDPAEERKHVREYQRMMASSIEADKKRELALKEKERLKDKAANALIHVWEEDVLKRWDPAMRERKTRELWWKGVAPRCRGTVWSRAIGNELGLTENSFQAALSRAREVEARVAGGKATTEDERRMAWFHQIRRDVQEQTWVELKIFQAGGPLHMALKDVLRAYAMYRSDIGYVSGCNTIAALLLLNLPTPSAVFIALANILNRSLPLSFYASDSGAKTSAYNFVLETLSQKSPKLHQHLENRDLGLEPDEYLAATFTALFTQNISLDEATRLWDVYVFERDNVLISAAVALLLDREMTLLSANTSEEVRRALDYRSKSDSQGKEDEWMALVRSAARS